MTLPSELRDLVRRRASAACEYCRLPEYASIVPHHIDHIVGRQHNGTDDPENLCLACIRCNLKKGPNIASVDPETGALTPLFRPRTHLWEEHFRLAGAKIEGQTPEGRATVFLLGMNDEERLRLREVLLRRGWTP